MVELDFIIEFLLGLASVGLAVVVSFIFTLVICISLVEWLEW